jgi:hypothetical protein
MGDHYHLLLEKPEVNLVAGMKWLQGRRGPKSKVQKRWSPTDQVCGCAETTAAPL